MGSFYVLPWVVVGIFDSVWHLLGLGANASDLLQSENFVATTNSLVLAIVGF